MLSPYLKRIIVDIFLFIALLLGFFYAYKVFVDFLISLFHFEGTRNIPSLAYCIYRSFQILLPLIMLTFFKKIPKIKIFKTMFFVMGCCYLLANTWIIYYMLNNSPVDLLYASIPRWFSSGELGKVIETAWANLYLYQYNNALVFNYLIWDSYDLWGVLFSTIQGILYLRLALKIDTSRGKVLKLILKILIISLGLPWIYNILIRKTYIFSAAWAQKNLLLLLEFGFIFIALNVASTSRSFWHDVLW